jgi:ribosomal protein L11 methyltransferase
VSIRVPLERAEEARAEWIERFPDGFEEVEHAGELELAAYVDANVLPGARVEEVEPGWEDRWRDFHHGVRVGPFWIGPPWEQPPEDARAIVIDPGRAFGTGAHPTTRLCVEFAAGLEAGSLLDVGCGSGVVAIAAVLAGVPRVLGLDVDPAAVEATERNAAANGVQMTARVLDALVDELPPADAVVANVSLEVVDALLPRLRARTVVTSGYLERDEPTAPGCVHRERRTLDGWAADVFERAQ